MQTLQRDVVGVVGSFTRCSSPINQRLAEAVANLLLLLIENLLRHFLPHKSQVASSRNHAQTDGFPGREEDRSFIAVILLPSEELLDGRVRKIAGCKNVRDESASL